MRQRYLPNRHLDANSSHRKIQIHRKTCKGSHEYVIKIVPNDAYDYKSQQNLFDILSIDYPSEIAQAFLQEYHEVKSFNQYRILKTWASLRVYEKAMVECFTGELFRFFLGGQQPKTKLGITSLGNVFVASKLVAYKATLQSFLRNEGTPFSNQPYLHHFAGGLILSLVARSRDVHFKQILITEDSQSIFIDFDACLEEEIRGRDKDFWHFNEFDFAYLPFVGKQGEKGGNFEPHNWLWSYLYERHGGAVFTERITSDLSRHENDPCTYLNPQFQRDKHRAMLKLILLPENIFSVISEKIAEQLLIHLPNSSLPPILADLILKRFLLGLNRLVSLVGKMPEFLQYLKNITLFEVANIARETDEAIKRDRYLSKRQTKTPEEIFVTCLKKIFKLNEAHKWVALEAPNQLYFINHIQEADRDTFLSKVFFYDLAHCDFFSKKTEDFYDFLLEFTYLDHLFLSGNLKQHHKIFPLSMSKDVPDIYIPSIQNRLEIISRSLNASELMKIPIAHCNLEELFTIMKSLSRSNIDPEAPYKNQPSSLFLMLDFCRLRILLSSFYTEKFLDQCIAVNLLNFLLAERQTMFRALNPDSYVSLASQVRPELISEFEKRFFNALGHQTVLQKGIHFRASNLRNAIEIASYNPQKTESQKQVINLFNDFRRSRILPGYFLETNKSLILYQLLVCQKNLYELISILIHIVFDEFEVKKTVSKEEPVVFFMMKYYFLTGEVIKSYVRNVLKAYFCKDTPEANAAFIEKYLKCISELLKEALERLVDSEPVRESVSVGDLRNFCLANSIFKHKPAPMTFERILANPDSTIIYPPR